MRERKKEREWESDCWRGEKGMERERERESECVCERERESESGSLNETSA